MSRFTRPPFHKPSPFDIPRPVHPISPPETEITTDSIQLPPMSFVSRDMGPGSFAEIGASSSFTRVDTESLYHTAPSVDAQSQTQAPTQTGRFRPRPSHLAYLHHPGTVRSDLRAAPRSATRWLIMVIPPPAIACEHGNGTFLNASSSSHSSNGVLLPLMPSLSGQLSAIAREFAFPSTTGICIFLHMSDGGVQFAPRISDESWSILWGAAFDERQSMHTMGGLPIAGRIEFDLDLKKARWFDMWLSSIKRNSVDMGSSVGGPGTFGGHHRREDSRTTMFEQMEDSMIDDVSVTTQRKVPTMRHVPRKLSLLDRVDISTTIRPSPRPSSSRAALSPTDAENPRLLLSPVAQTPIAVPVPTEEDSDEPQVATTSAPLRIEVERKVETWRASSAFVKSPLASTGQTALDPANMPNNQPLVETDAVPAGDELEPLNLDDFTWSISSAGPLSADYRVPIPLYIETDRPPSVHLDRRLEGSVCLTPTTCTSFGPPDYDPFSPVASLIDRLPSPDIAARQFEDVPPTPTTVTSWGAPSEWPESPAPLFRAPSVDLAARQLGSRPVTPSTATSWGAPLEWPASPATPFHVQTPDIGNMFFDGLDEERELLERGRALRASALDDEEPPRSLEDGNNDGAQVARPWKFVWPYQRVSTTEFNTCKQLPQRRNQHFYAEVESMPVAKPWKHVWPYQNVANDVSCPVNVRLTPAYPSFDLYPAVYPHFDLYPAKPLSVGTGREVNVKLEPKYPNFSIYPAVYPDFEIYPGHVVKAQKNPRQLGTVLVRLEPEYPVIRLYPAVYPDFEIYPGHIVKAQKSLQELGTVSVRLEPEYPVIRLYPPVYPHFDLYPALPVMKTSGSRQPSRKPTLPSHVEGSVAQKAAPWKHVWPYQRITDDAACSDVRLDSAVKSESKQPRRKPSLPSNAEHSNIHGAAPWKHVWPYQRATKDITHTVNVRLEATYPSFDIYPAVYPHFDLYPETTLAIGTTKAVSLKLEAKYPAFSVYPAVYPNFEIYPGHVAEAQKNAQGISVRLKSSYPSLEIYSAVYPYLVIYPEVTIKNRMPTESKSSIDLPTVSPSQQETAAQTAAKSPISVTLGTTYPNLDIYPAVYPYFDIYRSGKPSKSECRPEVLRVALKAKYPVLEPYPPVYPYFDIYKSGKVTDLTPLATKLSTKLRAKYPALDIYRAVYPNLDIYPSDRMTIQAPSPVPTRSVRRPRKTHQELVDIVPAQNAPSAPVAPALIVPIITVSSEENFPQPRRPRRTHKELVERVFPPKAEVVAAPPQHEEVTPSRKPRRIPQARHEETTSRPRLPADVPQDVGSVDSSPRRISRPSGLPVRPSEIRRSVSLQQGTMSSSFGVTRSMSLRHLPSVREENMGSRTLVGATPRAQLSPERKPVKRDSLVLERARQWGGTTGESKPTRPPVEPTSRVSMKDLSEFPMPPHPPIPGLPNGVRPSSSAANRPVAKLDRTKFPFR